MKSKNKNLTLALLAASALAVALPAFGQDPGASSPPPSGGWRRFESSNPAPPPDAQEPAPQMRTRNQAPPPPRTGPLTVPAGSWITIRVNEPISSDHSQPGDMFTATLAQPLIANGRIIARRGQMVSGVVSEAVKAGRVKGVSRLGLELTEIGLADGRQVQVKTRLMERRGETSYGRDAVGIGTTVGTGAAIGAAVNGGVGAGVGAAAGVVASTIGVLLTRGRATEVYPEQPLTFRLETPISVDAYDEAFQYVSQEDYDQRPPARRAPSRAYGPPPPYYGYPYYYGGWFSPYYGYGFGPNFYFSYHRGFRRR
ncbi:MAG TPA: hypothetical protein VIX89_04495 [Bryobacteraceae bacterium]